MEPHEWVLPGVKYCTKPIQTKYIWETICFGKLFRIETITRSYFNTEHQHEIYMGKMGI